MKQYHYNWLSIHPFKSEQWLRYMLSEGFHMHHVDGNHDNDDPYNLALMFGVDHSRLHASGQVQKESQKYWTFRKYVMLFAAIYAIMYLLLSMA